MSLLDKAKEQAQDLVDKAKHAAGRFAGEHAGDRSGDHSGAHGTDGNAAPPLHPAPADRITDAAQDARDKYLGH